MERFQQQQEQEQQLGHSPPPGPAPPHPGDLEAAFLLVPSAKDSFSIPAVRGSSGREVGGVGMVPTLWRRVLQSRRLPTVPPTAPCMHPQHRNQQQQQQQQQQPKKEQHGTGDDASGSVSECALDVRLRAALVALSPPPLLRRRTRAVVAAAARPSADENEPWLLR